MNVLNDSAFALELYRKYLGRLLDRAPS